MENLKENIETEINYWLDIKIQNADMPERAVEAIHERIDLLVDDINELLDIADKDVDEVMYEFSEENLKDIKADLKYQDKKEANLWN